MGNRRLFWVRMHDVKEGLGVTNMSHIVRKEIHGIFETKNPIKNQIRKYKRFVREFFKVDIHTSVCSGLILRIIKNCRGEKGRGEKKR